MKTLLQQLCIFLFALFLITGCTKELSTESGTTNSGGTSVITLSGNGVCSGTVVKGSYIIGIAAGDSNTVSLTINVTTTGTYNITTNTVNGIVFSAQGFFTAKGIQTITLYGSGTPLKTGSFNFVPAEADCNFSLTVTESTGSTSGSAVYTFSGSTDNCTNTVVSGTYIAGLILTTANSISLQVNVTTAGTYTLSTNSVNGFVFSGAGSFTATGLHNIILTANGTPAAAGSFSFKAANNGCTFVIPVLPGSTQPASGSFQVKINGVLQTFNLEQATFIRSVETNEKRLDIGGISTDGKYRLYITVGDSTAVGNTVGTGDKPVRLFLEDDLATTDIDESVDSYAFYTISTSLGNNNWYTDVYGIKGLINISKNTSVVNNGIISGAFAGTFTTLNDVPTLTFTLSEGVFTDINYVVLN